MKLYSVLLIAAVTGFIACKKTSSGDPVPKIAYSGLSKDSIVNAGKDTISIMFTIVDGDGDMPFDDDSTKEIFIRDSRTPTNAEIGLKMPEFPKGLVKGGQSLDMKCTINLDAFTYFVLRPSRPNGDTLSFDIYVKDRAGNKSNMITTRPIYIQPT